MPTVAIYPGSFDPITLGHIDVVKRASRMFDKIVIAVANNLSKQSLFDLAQRLELIRQSIGNLPNIIVESFEGLTVDFAKKHGATVIVRGLRAISDFEYEFQLSQMNKILYPQLETVFVMASLEYTFISSSVIREVARLGGDVSQLVPAPVLVALQTAFRPGRTL